jgi:F-type H+-transporting ATPase subunit b
MLRTLIDIRTLATGMLGSVAFAGAAFAAETEGHEGPLLANPEFWLGVAFVVFIAVIAKPIGKAASGALDKRSQEIAKGIDEAQALHAEAKAALEAYKMKLADAGREASEIVTNAEAEARRMRETAEKELAATLKRREELALEKIAQAEARATKDVRDAAVEVALAATRKLIAEGLSPDRANALIDEAVKNLPKQLH